MMAFSELFFDDSLSKKIVSFHPPSCNRVAFFFFLKFVSKIFFYAVTTLAALSSPYQGCYASFPKGMLSALQIANRLPGTPQTE